MVGKVQLRLIPSTTSLTESINIDFQRLNAEPKVFVRIPWRYEIISCSSLPFTFKNLAKYCLLSERSGTIKSEPP